jgi:tetratricopeptide (TPR) repeat protein
MNMMRRASIFICLLFGSFLLVNAQKSKVIAAFQLIETEKFKEAKELVEEALQDDKTKDWYRTWHAKGLLCQKAYEAGKKAKGKEYEKNKDNFELYPDQLFVAYEAYEKAQALDTRGRINTQLAPNYVLLANELQKTGQAHFRNEDFENALKTFEAALKINRDPILSVKIDSNLIYNTALAAFETEEWDKAIDYLNDLNETHYSPNVPKLMYSIYLQEKDSTSAEEVLTNGIARYEENEDLILLLADLLVKREEIDRAIAILDSASIKDTTNYIFPYTKGLILQKLEQYDKAIESYEIAYNRAPGETKILSHIGTSYYNKGVEFDENARSTMNNRLYREEKENATRAFRSALSWFEKAWEKDPGNQQTAGKLYELYRLLGVTEKIID